MLPSLHINETSRRTTGSAAERGRAVIRKLGLSARHGLFLAGMACLMTLLPLMGRAAPFAAYVIDARSGEVLYEENATTRLHPASLTKMMTLYITFQAIERGEISLDTRATVTRNAASEPPSRLGLKPGQKIAVRYLIRAAALRSANDAATTLGELIGGSETAFAERMNRTAKQIGMTNTTFQNANGLTKAGHMSTARDMTILGRRLFYDFPQYYNIFSRRASDAGIAQVANTNRRFLDAYKGADGIKTGFTNAAGFNLTASAERGGKRIIATVFGAASTPARNAKMAELLDIGFKKAPTRAPVSEALVAQADPEPVPAPLSRASSMPNIDASRAIQVALAAPQASAMAPPSSTRPAKRPERAPDPALIAAIRENISSVVAEVHDAPARRASASLVMASVAPDARPALPFASEGEDEAAIEEEGDSSADTVASPAPVVPAREMVLAAAVPAPPSRPALATAAVHKQPTAKPQAAALAPAPPEGPEVVTRLSTSGGRFWGVNLGRFNSRYEAEKVLLRTALSEMGTLSDGLRKVVQRPTGFDATFMGLTQDTADLACRRLQARNIQCFTVGPS